MRGQLVAVPAGRHETWIGLSGEYQPPLGLLGRLLNRVVGFHVAHAAMDDSWEMSPAIWRQTISEAIEDE
jgi:hypothetical protein